MSRASRAGIRAIEHLGPGLTIIAGCSTDEVSLAEAIAGLPAPRLPSVKLPFMDRILMRVLRKVVINPVNRSTPAEVEILQQAVDTFSEERAAELAEQFAEDGTWQVPTLIRLRTQYLCDAPEFSDDPDLQYMAESTTKSWQGATETFVKKFPPPSRATFRAAYEVLLRMTKIFSDGGVPMLAGSDAVGAAWEVPGPVTAPRVRRARPGRPARAPHPADDHPRRGRVPRRQLAHGHRRRRQERRPGAPATPTRSTTPPTCTRSRP